MAEDVDMNSGGAKVDEVKPDDKSDTTQRKEVPTVSEGSEVSE